MNYNNEPNMITIKPEKELIKNKINELKFDSVRARSKMKLLNILIDKIDEDCNVSELKEWMKDQALYYEDIMLNIRDFLREFRKQNKNNNGFSYEEIKIIRKQILRNEAQ
jgi:hypothetical protein